MELLLWKDILPKGFMAFFYLSVSKPLFRVCFKDFCNLFPGKRMPACPVLVEGLTLRDVIHFVYCTLRLRSGQDKKVSAPSEAARTAGEVIEVIDPGGLLFDYSRIRSLISIFFFLSLALLVSTNFLYACGLEN